jgi:hypothetical protein
MTTSTGIGVLALGLMTFAPIAGAHEFPLQFTPNPGYRNLVVAGYEFVGSTVVGTCSYSTVSGGVSGKGGHGGTPRLFQQICTWDLTGNLLHMRSGVITPPPAISSIGGVVIYARDANGNTTGTDTKLPERGFVNSPGAHYTWLTPNHNAIALPFVYTLNLSLKSDGDTAVDITSVTPSSLHGSAALKSTDCIGMIDVGKTCTITVTYDTTMVPLNNGVGSDTLRVDLVSPNAAASSDFIQIFTIIGADKN